MRDHESGGALWLTCAAMFVGAWMAGEHVSCGEESRRRLHHHATMLQPPCLYVPQELLCSCQGPRQGP